MFYQQTHWQDCGRNRNRRKKCVSWYLCSNSSIVTDGAFLIDDRMDDGQPSRELCPSMQTCCGPKDEIKVEIEDSGESEETTTTTVRTTKGPVRGRTTTKKPTSWTTTKKPPPPPTMPRLKNDCKTYTGGFDKPTRCGARNVNGFGKKLVGKGDKYAQYGEFPWMMAVLTEVEDSKGKKFYKYRCGGSLIHSKLVVTAAHRWAAALLFSAFCLLRCF